jgi:hypothetical protein
MSCVYTTQEKSVSKIHAVRKKDSQNYITAWMNCPCLKIINIELDIAQSTSSVTRPAQYRRWATEDTLSFQGDHRYRA